MRTGGQGGRFDATDKEDNMMLRQLHGECTEAVLTEGVGIKAPSGWAIRGLETKRLWNKKLWQHQHSDVVRIDTPNWHRGTKPMDHFPLEYSFLTRENVSLLLGGGHFPAHLTKTDQRLANEAALAGLRKAVLKLKNEFQPEIITLFFDLNRDLKLEKNRDMIRASVRGTGLKLARLPKPDLRGRYISAFLTTGEKWETTMLDRVPGYDHRGGVLHTTAK